MEPESEPELEHYSPLVHRLAEPSVVVSVAGNTDQWTGPTRNTNVRRRPRNDQRRSVVGRPRPRINMDISEVNRRTPKRSHPGHTLRLKSASGCRVAKPTNWDDTMAAISHFGGLLRGGGCDSIWALHIVPMLYGTEFDGCFLKKASKYQTECNNDILTTQVASVNFRFHLDTITCPNYVRSH